MFGVVHSATEGFSEGHFGRLWRFVRLFLGQFTVLLDVFHRCYGGICLGVFWDFVEVCEDFLLLQFLVLRREFREQSLVLRRDFDAEAIIITVIQIKC